MPVSSLCFVLLRERLQWQIPRHYSRDTNDVGSVRLDRNGGVGEKGQ